MWLAALYTINCIWNCIHCGFNPCLWSFLCEGLISLVNSCLLLSISHDNRTSQLYSPKLASVHTQYWMSNYKFHGYSDTSHYTYMLHSIRSLFISQWYGHCQLWINRWILTLPLSLNDLVHTSQWYCHFTLRTRWRVFCLSLSQRTY